MSTEHSHKWRPVLDSIDRVSEIVFGILMAMTFTGTLSVATAGHEQVRTMMLTALGCNLAWGLTDAVMYIVRAGTERHRKIVLLRRVQAMTDHSKAHQLIADELGSVMAANLQPSTLEMLREGLLAYPVPATRLGLRDYSGALGVFALVVLATFPVVVPFMFIDSTAIALRVSNLLALSTLFIGGCALGRYTGGRPWIYGVALSAIGVVLVTIIVALGG